MPDLDALAARHGFPAEAARHLLDALARGQGRQAMFDHPALGGPGQWQAGGMTMIAAMFDDGLKARVAALCADLAPLAGEARPAADRARAWWPEGLGAPSASGAQDGTRYAVLPDSRRLAVLREGRVILYDTGEHRIGGVSQQQGAGGDLAFTSQRGTVRLHELETVAAADGGAGPREPAPPPAPAGPTGEDIPALIARLSDLRAQGHLTEAEFAAKKAELLGRL